MSEQKAETKTEKETKLCKHCQTEIPKKAKVCPNCRKKQGGKLKWIIIVLIVIFVISSCSSDEESNKDDISEEKIDQKVSESNEKATKEEGGDENETSYISVGDTFEKSGLKITLNEAVVDFQDYEDEYGWNAPEDGMKYIMASFTFENTSDSDRYVSIYDFDCYADNTNCEEEFGLDDDDFVNTNLSSGRNVSFKVYFEVPINAENIELEYELNAWTEEKAIIKIQ